MGWALWIVPSRIRTVTEENIHQCFPMKSIGERKSIVKQSLISHSLTLLESTKAWTESSTDSRAKILKIEGKHEVDQLIAQGNGVLIIIPHLGNWEYLNHYLGDAYKLTHMYLPSKNTTIDHIIQNGRRKSGTIFVEANRAGIKQQLKALVRGGVIGVMPDQEPAKHTGFFVPFFGIEALTSELVIRYLEKTKATPVLAYCTRRSDKNGFDITIKILGKHLSLEKMNEAIASTIDSYPDQYLWSYKRFRTRPDGEPDFYRPRRSVYIEPAKQFVLGFLVFMTKYLSFNFIENISNNPLINKLAFHHGRKIARTNLSLCSQNEDLLNPSMVELTKLALELGKVWHGTKSSFKAIYSGHHINLSGKGAIVLTPPLGNREIVMRYLGEGYRTTEYYHPADNQSVDSLIRKARLNWSIKLVEHDASGVTTLMKDLSDNNVVTLCPDQQPRLRGGEFVPFFSCPALTTIRLSQVIKESGADLYFGVAIRRHGKFDLQFIRVKNDIKQNHKQILTHINQQLEELIAQNPSQYRWTDKRFNIRPPSMKKVYD